MHTLCINQISLGHLVCATRMDRCLHVVRTHTAFNFVAQRGSNSQPNFLHNYCDGDSRPAFKHNQEQEEWSRAQRIERSRNAHYRLTQKLLDKRYRALYVAVARLFAGQLAKDSAVMDKTTALPAHADQDDRMALVHALSLALKWAPTPGRSHDRITNISSAICLLLHEAQVFSPVAHRITFSVATSLPGSEMHLLRYIYQKHILTRGRRYTCIPEPFMSSNRFPGCLHLHGQQQRKVFPT
ncbi:hypothetical protein J3R82DRAFT_4866 [Butyriboletus roseoflavus]|nr:hypothetical protein J3R82DRAFT_4866 [Butyriboletus roseoflavus]